MSTFDMTLVPQDEAYQALRNALSAGQVVHLTIHPPTSSKVIRRGDRVRVPFDDGMGPATVVDIGAESDGEKTWTWVTVAYGPDDRYRTNMPMSSVESDRVVHSGPTLEVKPA